MTFNRGGEMWLYVIGLACCFGMAADIAASGQLTWRWPLLAALFIVGFWYSYTGGKLE